MKMERNMKKSFIRIAAALLLLTLGGTAWSADTTLTWHGHAAFDIVTPKARY